MFNIHPYVKCSAHAEINIFPFIAHFNFMLEISGNSLSVIIFCIIIFCATHPSEVISKRRVMFINSRLFVSRTHKFLSLKCIFSDLSSYLRGKLWQPVLRSWRRRRNFQLLSRSLRELIQYVLRFLAYCTFPSYRNGTLNKLEMLAL